MIWAHLEEKGFTRNVLTGNRAVVDALATTVERHCRRVDAVRPVIGNRTQPYVAQLVKRLSAPDDCQVLVVHGRAGAGKSTIAADAVRELASAGWFAAVVRMDTADPALQTAAALGRVFDLSRSPAILLAGVTDGSPAVLLVDQLDAVSTYSGRMPDSYDAVAELLNQVAPLSNIKVVLAVRTVDLESDSRMRSLLADESRVDTLEVGDLAPEEVRTALSNVAGWRCPSFRIAYTLDGATVRPMTRQLSGTPPNPQVATGGRVPGSYRGAYDDGPGSTQFAELVAADVFTC